MYQAVSKDGKRKRSAKTEAERSEDGAEDVVRRTTGDTEGVFRDAESGGEDVVCGAEGDGMVFRIGGGSNGRRGRGEAV